MKLSDVLQRDLTLELWDYGTAIEEFDWSRLPTFKSPHEHGFYAGEHKPRRHTIKNSAVLRTLMRPRGLSQSGSYLARSASARTRLALVASSFWAA